MIKKAKIVSSLYKKHKSVFTRNDIIRIIYGFWSIVNDEMIKGNKVVIKNLGSFMITQKGKRNKEKEVINKKLHEKEINRKKMKKYNDKLDYWKELAEYNQWLIVNGHQPFHRLPLSFEGRKTNIKYIRHSAIDE